MDYSLIIGLITFISAGAVTYFTVRKDKSDRLEAAAKEKKANLELGQAKDTIVALQTAADKQLREYHEESARTMDSLNRKQEVLIKDQQNVILLQRENQRKSDKLNELQSQTINEMTGGNSYCLLDIRILPNYLDKSSQFLEMISLQNVGEYPLQDIQITLEKPQLKWDKSRTEGYASSINDKDLNISFSVPYLAETKKGSQKTGILLLQRPIPDYQLVKEKITYSANIVLRKGIYNQMIKLALYKSAWLEASKLSSNYVKGFNPIIDVHPYFPTKKEDGTIDWTIIEN